MCRGPSISRLGCHEWLSAAVVNVFCSNTPCDVVDSIEVNCEVLSFPISYWVGIMPDDETIKISKRNLVFGGLFAAAAAIIYPVVSDRAIKYWDQLDLQEKADVSVNELLRTLIGEVSSYTVAPGRHNLDYFAKEHPDIFEPYYALRGLWQVDGCNYMPLKSNELPNCDIQDSIFLIGGPVSNDLARSWQGYVRNPETKILEYNEPAHTRLRWRFNYEIASGARAAPTRYIDGRMHESWLQEIIDNETGTPLYASLTAPEGLIRNDWLLLSYLPSPYGRRFNSYFFDASDLHGQGVKILPSVLQDQNTLSEIRNALPASSNYLDGGFQALIEVFVKHENSVSIVTGYQLKDVAVIH